MIQIEQNVALAPLAWWKVGGPAEYLARPKSVEDLKEALLWAADNNVPVTVLGGASNVLISDQGVQGLVILTREMSGVEVTMSDDRLHLAALAGTNKAELTKIFLQHKLAPALFLCGLPGDVAGGVVMNAGVGEAIVPREFVDIVDWVEVARIKTQTTPAEVEVLRFKKSDLEWQYRHSAGWQPGVIVRVGMSWPHHPNPDVMNQVRLATRKRLQSQPLDWPSGGSTFRNPPSGKAGALIEQAGLKGFIIGAAEVSQKHANFIINRGGASATDVMAVLRHVQQTVKEKHGVELIPEVKFLGRW
ncbi:MAG: UDP-N-acetylmuramate dehydrogenase [Bdellovibrionales bacterium]